MKLHRMPKNEAYLETARRILQGLLNPEPIPKPICGESCTVYVDQDCNRDCPDLRFALSSDPKNYPLEPKIAPLVYELKLLQVFEPCWSCEGHLGLKGELWKMPEIWFYARSVVHVRLLAEAITELHERGLLKALWEVAICQTERDDIETCFSLRPGKIKKAVSLDELQDDLDIFARFIRGAVLNRAKKLAIGMEKS